MNIGDCAKVTHDNGRVVVGNITEIDGTHGYFIVEAGEQPYKVVWEGISGFEVIKPYEKKSVSGEPVYVYGCPR